ncbi:hypothetical protein PsorP6_009262 [Peronosclerospora sorghi]|uniref:Uncharacterized protein n=1 Tax=Peronosclerospora sorghi TaxID=230839 RepID=A0ACC0VYE4_9STRA|nr:hypothetical protein PsorP6_009262 [Peronosclerospora sorghi]
MTKEFVPVDLQERLGEKLDALKQKHCKNLEDYIMKFRKIMSDIKEMSDLDRYEQRTRRHLERSPTIVNNSGVDRDGDVIMDAGNTNLSKDECVRKKLFFYCKKPGHRLAECRSIKHNNQQNKKSVQVSNMVMKSVSEDKEEDMIDTIVIGHVTAKDKSNELIRKEGCLGDARVKILIDSGADHNIIRPRLGTHMFQNKKIQAVRFDESTTPRKMTNVFKEEIMMEGQVFKDITLT